MPKGNPITQFIAETDFIDRVEEYVDRAEQGESFHLIRHDNIVASLLPPSFAGTAGGNGMSEA